MPFSGQFCMRTGMYRSRCYHRISRFLRQRERFPNCNDCMSGVDWVMVYPVRE